MPDAPSGSASSTGCPELLGRWPYGESRAVAVSGGYAYFSSGTTLLVVDVGGPSPPVIVLWPGFIFAF